ncbi:hypothetical protein ACGF4C_20260 [Streptomyces sp. NPDC048197]|uniref:hypothetical protein n=1 Tax=Streptomyces sp. NPDC048197 TaxID=3365511 RepID=UPI00371FED41
MDTIDALVEILGSRARTTTPEEQLLRFDEMWRQAALAETPLEEVVPPDLTDTTDALASYLASNPEHAAEFLQTLRVEAKEQRQLATVRFMLDRGVVSVANLPVHLLEALRQPVRRRPEDPGHHSP